MRWGVDSKLYRPLNKPDVKRAMWMYENVPGRMGVIGRALGVSQNYLAKFIRNDPELARVKASWDGKRVVEGAR